MMRSVFLDVRLPFTSAASAYASEDALLWFLGVVARLNLYHLRAHPETPKLYSREAGIRWCPPDQMEGPWIDEAKIPNFAKALQLFGMREEKAAIILRLVSGAEIFQDIPNLYATKKGDCDRLVGARLAELWLAGQMVSPYLIPHKNGSGGTTYHAVVHHLADNSTEDPSVILGMAGDRDGEIRKNLERKDNLVRAATDLMLVDGVSPEALGAIIDQAAYVPVGGFR